MNFYVTLKPFIIKYSDVKSEMLKVFPMLPIIDYEWKIRKVGPSAVTFETKMFLRLTIIQSRNCIGRPPYHIIRERWLEKARARGC